MIYLYKTVENLVACAQKGDAQAQRELGCQYWWGDEGLPKDVSLARHWYSLAAAQGHCEALYDLSTMLLEGEGGAKDVPAALDFLRRAALRRRWDPDAECAAKLLADIYRGGYFSVTPDAAEAERWEAIEREQERKHRGWRRQMGRGSHSRA